MFLGWGVRRRSPTSILVRESHVEKVGRVQDCEYEILNVLEFNSLRKRQSVICRCPDGRIVLYCKVITSSCFPPPPWPLCSGALSPDPLGPRAYVLTQLLPLRPVSSLSCWGSNTD